jgi:hypothetical protein
MSVQTEPEHHLLPVPPRKPRGRHREGPRWARRAVTALLAGSALLLPWGTGVAQAAPSDPPLGVDISYPQCNKPLPTGQAFAIVGVNGGNAESTNPCLATELAWAAKSVGGTVHDDVQLYVNTGNPAGRGAWPRSGTNLHGDCDGSNSRPCAYQYGWERARADATSRGIRHPEQYMWWLDVELANSWDYSKGGSTRNAAVLEGMTDYFTSINSRGVGLYSSRYQWGLIIGNGVDSDSSLNGLANWRPTGSTVEGARINCGLEPLTPGGRIEMTQFTTEYDYNYSCI